MKKRNLLLFTTSLVSGLFVFNRNKKGPQITSEDPRFFAGTWNYLDKENRQHLISIDLNYNLLIDHKSSDFKLVSRDIYELAYIDQYGYKLIIKANESRPISFYDEADDLTYNLSTI